MPRHKVSPLGIELMIEGDGSEEAKLEGETRMELVEDLPRAEVFFMGVGAGEVEVKLVEGSLG